MSEYERSVNCLNNARVGSVPAMFYISCLCCYRVIILVGNNKRLKLHVLITCYFIAQFVEVAYGIKKLQIICVVEDDKIGTDFLEEEICGLEDYVSLVQCHICTCTYNHADKWEFTRYCSA